MALRDIRPYMLHAHIQWLDDSGEIPHIVVLNGPGVVFPPHLREAPHLLFNVSADACQGLDISDEGVSFSGRFGGRVFKVECPLDAVMTVQNKAVTFMVSFAPQEEMVAGQGPNEPVQSSDAGTNTDEERKPHLTLVSGANSEPQAPAPARRGLHLVKGPDSTDSPK